MILAETCAHSSEAGCESPSAPSSGCGDCSGCSSHNVASEQLEPLPQFASILTQRQQQLRLDLLRKQPNNNNNVNDSDAIEDSSSPQFSRRVVAVSLSAQSRASLACHFGLTSEDLVRRMETLFVNNNNNNLSNPSIPLDESPSSTDNAIVASTAVFPAQWSFDILADATFAAQISLLATAQEFIDRKRAKMQREKEQQQQLAAVLNVVARDIAKDNSDTHGANLSFAANRTPSFSDARPLLPLLTSHCPGIVSYAQQTHHYLLPHLSPIKSQQQIMGCLLKSYLPKKTGIDSASVYHISIMPCLDKRTESKRVACAEVDLVLTTEEFLEAMHAAGMDKRLLAIDSSDDSFVATPNALAQFAASLSNFNSETQKFFSTHGGPSDGYFEFVLNRAALELFGVSESKQVITKNTTNENFHETFLELDGEIVLRFCAVYGFRNLHHVTRALKQRTSEYDFVEIMACPGGCVNGGGQIKRSAQLLEPNESVSNATELLDQVRAIHESQEDKFNESIVPLMHDWIDLNAKKSQTADRAETVAVENELRVPSINALPFFRQSFAVSTADLLADAKKGCKCSSALSW